MIGTFEDHDKGNAQTTTGHTGGYILRKIKKNRHRKKDRQRKKCRKTKNDSKRKKNCRERRLDRERS